MSAEVETMFYYGETPWHGQCTAVDKALTAVEAIGKAGLGPPTQEIAQEQGAGPDAPAL